MGENEAGYGPSYFTSTVKKPTGSNFRLLLHEKGRLLTELLQIKRPKGPYQLLSRISASFPKREGQMTKNIVALQNGLVVVPNGSSDNDQLAASLQAELMNLGFILEETAYKAVSLASKQWISDFYSEIVPAMKKKMGAGHAFKPFYRNFPKQVMEMSELELFVNAFIHYLSGGKWEPSQKLEKRGIAFEKTNWKKIKLGTEKDFQGIFTRLCSINQSLTETDKETIGWFCDSYKDWLVFPENIPFKETLCILAAKGFDVPVKQATDVLRVAVYLSGGDISLPSVPSSKFIQTSKHGRRWSDYFLTQMNAARQAEREKFKFKKFSRPERRMIMTLLEKTTLDLSEMQGRLGRWLRLGEILHVGEFRNKFPRTFMAFGSLRNQDERGRIRTFHGQVDLAFKEHWTKGIKVLSTRPGEYARKLDWMLRSFEPKQVLDTFVYVGNKISSKVLFELYSHFDKRSNPDSCRSIIIKGKRAKMKVLEPLPPMDAKLVSSVKDSILKIIRKKVGNLPPLGNVWIDERLKDVPLPMAMRSVNAAIKTYIRGTKIPFDADCKVIRPFLHWFDAAGEIDMDLSVSFHDEDLKMLNHISYTNLKINEYGSCHSGDIRCRRGACAEYVDVDINTCLKRGVRYALVHAYNFNGGAMHEVKDCVFGMMEREHPEAGRIFVPKTISNCMALANESPSVFVCVLDLEKRNYIWVDLETERFGFLENNASMSMDVINSILQGSNISVYDLLAIHAKARGEMVSSPENAKTKFDWETLVTSYSEIAQYMTF